MAKDYELVSKTDTEIEVKTERTEKLYKNQLLQQEASLVAHLADVKEKLAEFDK